ncbi:hypothetical protein KI387_017362, partial [Taxus chinensis]
MSHLVSDRLGQIRPVRALLSQLFRDKSSHFGRFGRFAYFWPARPKADPLS